MRSQEVARGPHAMRAHQAGAVTSTSVPPGRISNLGNMSGPADPPPSRHGVERFRNRRQLVHGDPKVADIGPPGPPHLRQLTNEVSPDGGDRNESLRRRHKTAAISESDGLPRPGYIGSRLQKE